MSLYPIPTTVATNPLTSNLDADGFGIVDASVINMASGAITGVSTINGIIYSPSLVALPVPINFDFPANITIFGDGTYKTIFTIYDPVSAPALGPIFTNPNVKLILLTIPVNIQTQNGTSDQGLMDFQLNVNGSLPTNLHSGQYIISPPSQYNPFDMQLMNVVTLFFILQNGVEYSSSTPTNVLLGGRGGYNWDYIFNLNAQHPGDSLPTVCNAVALR